ncbi:integrase core domain-containing protein [Paraburkholderia monticola]|uniref:integrase core domain-containing protein n=1 Tax=Paraburkholderia monticola TaxID=1399968 RepID=UPI0007C66A1F|nr:integrase core domain-containing protein [Paraburkholderia monticola]
MLVHLLRRRAHGVNRRRVLTLIKGMDVEALYIKPTAIHRDTQHNIWPYLLRGLKTERANPTAALDTTYIPTMHGFIYLTPVMNGLSCKVLAHGGAITLKAKYAIEVPEEALARCGLPDIVSTDQGGLFAAGAFTEAVLRVFRLSMDGRGSCCDNVFAEQVWRSLRYEGVYLKANESVSHARRSIGEYIELLNRKQPPFEPSRSDAGRHTSRRCLRSNRRRGCVGCSIQKYREPVRTSQGTPRSSGVGGIRFNKSAHSH